MFWPLKIYQGLTLCYHGEGEKSGGFSHGDGKGQVGNGDKMVT